MALNLTDVPKLQVSALRCSNQKHRHQRANIGFRVVVSQKRERGDNFGVWMDGWVRGRDNYAQKETPKSKERDTRGGGKREKAFGNFDIFGNSWECISLFSFSPRFFRTHSRPPRHPSPRPQEIRGSKIGGSNDFAADRKMGTQQRRGKIITLL